MLWKNKVEDREAAVFHATLQRKVARQQAAKQMASKLMDFSNEHWRLELNLMDKPEACFRQVQKHMSAIQKVHRVTDSDINCVIVCNWSAPTVLTSEGQRRQASLMTTLVNRSHSNNMGLVLTPSHSNKKGFLWKEEEKARNLLCQGNEAQCNLDGQFSLSFNARLDLRDTRT